MTNSERKWKILWVVSLHWTAIALASMAFRQPGWPSLILIALAVICLNVATQFILPPATKVAGGHDIDGR